jgi:uncharacterized protein (TIGR03083 family)
VATPGTAVDEPVVPALLAEWAALDALLSDLDEARWTADTCLPGWRVRDVVAHLIGTEAMLAGATPPPAEVDVQALPHVRNELAATNELWVHALSSEPTAALLERFRAVTRDRADALAALTAADFDAPSWTPAGESTYRRFMEIRLFDCWLHEQDIRDAVGRPGHETGPCADAAVEQIGRSLGYVVGKRAGAPDGSAVTIELSGPVCRSFHVVVEGRARVVDGLDRPATAALTLSSNLFVRLAGGRVDPATALAEVGFTGDAELGRRVAGNLAFTP